MANDTENKWLAAAIRLQKHGFRVFPIACNTKDQPTLSDPAGHASADPEKARLWWECQLTGEPVPDNIGITCRNLADGRRLIGVDIDCKKGRDGELGLLALELDGKEFPDTFEQTTASGTRHLIYWTTALISNSRSKLALGIDIRGRGGYLVGAGSEIDGKAYSANFAPIAEAPAWLVEACQETKAERVLSTESAKVDVAYAYRRGEAFIAKQAGASEGLRGSSAYALACQLKDFGVSSFAAFEILSDWAERCEPPMPEVDLELSVENAYKYGQNDQGSSSPEAAFDEITDEEEPKKKPVVVQSPIETLNHDHAFVISGGGHHILWETTDAKGNAKLEHIKEQSFHKKFAAKTMVTGSGKFEPITKVWMSSSRRRSYAGFCFRPGLPTPGSLYNLWRGFAVEPVAEENASVEDRFVVARFMEHLRDNVCLGNDEHFNWLLGWFAHAIQRPWEKPLTSIVLKGGKGVGKSIVVEIIGELLLGLHFLSTADKRYLIGNFNSHLENCLFLALEEAFWSGDMAANGILKNLITSKQHVIEHKGQEPYRVENCTRIAIIGNEDWIVPASEDERRFAVFEVGDSRQQDTAYFQRLWDGMAAGGIKLLLRHLLDFDLSTVNVNKAPMTEGLLKQKIESFGPVSQWWYECLSSEELVSNETDGWPEHITKDSLRLSISRYYRMRHITSRVPDERALGRQLVRIAGVQATKVKAGDKWVHAYTIPSVEEAKRHLARVLGHEVTY